MGWHFMKDALLCFLAALVFYLLTNAARADKLPALANALDWMRWLAGFFFWLNLVIAVIASAVNFL